VWKGRNVKESLTQASLNSLYFETLLIRQSVIESGSQLLVLRSPPSKLVSGIGGPWPLGPPLASPLVMTTNYLSVSNQPVWLCNPKLSARVLHERIARECSKYIVRTSTVSVCVHLYAVMIDSRTNRRWIIPFVGF